MRILVVSGTPHIPQRSGGVPSSTHDLALELQQRGQEVSVLCGLTDEGGLTSLALRVLRKLSGRRFPVDRWPGYPVYRQWQVLSSIPAAVREIAPDVAIVQVGNAVRLAQELGSCGVPVLFYLHNTKMELLGGDPRTLTATRFIANSSFTARRYKDSFGIDSIVIPPLFRAERYVSPRRPANVTFVNPSVQKGRDIAFKIAEHCPEIPFSFIESWDLSPQEVEELRTRMAALPNITLRRRTDNMKSVYDKAKIILAPSICEEAWGRVVTEAHFNGIPVVASTRGGLPESVGPGGVLLDPDGPIEPWVDAVRRLWTNADFYREKSAAALAYSRRAEIDPARQFEALLAAASQLIAESVAVKSAGRHDDARATADARG